MAPWVKPILASFWLLSLCSVALAAESSAQRGVAPGLNLQSCRPVPSRVMALQAKPVSVSFWLMCLCSVACAGVHRLSYLQLISPQAAPGLPRRLSVERMNDLVISAYDSDTGKLAPRHGYTPGDKNSHQFWSMRSARCPVWDSWVETEYQALVREMNTSSPKTEPYYMQVLKICELDDATGAAQAITRYSLNGEDVLRYQSDQNRWFSVHPAAWRVAERWNREGETFGVMKLFTPQRCKFWIESSAPFTAQKTAQPTARVALVPGTQDRPRRLICHVTGFYPRDIEVTWERGGQVAQGEQLTSGIQPNGDPTFQIQGPVRGHITRRRHSHGPLTLLKPRLSQQEAPFPRHFLSWMPPSDQMRSWLCQGYQLNIWRYPIS